VEAGRSGHRPVEVLPEVTEMVVNRMIDDAAVAAASLARGPVRAAREQALRHALSPGAAVWGAAPDVRVSPEWAAWANLLMLHDATPATQERAALRAAGLREAAAVPWRLQALGGTR
jgi:2-methylcitrate dehydratase PrpD